MLDSPKGLNIPGHVAIIMDGNGRWALARGLPRAAGHRAGAEALRHIVETAAKNGVRYLTLYSFSSENWKRPETEVRSLMDLLRRYLKAEIASLHDNDVRLRVIGDRSLLATDIARLITDAERMTASNRRLTLVLALNYGGRAEIASAARKLAHSAALGLVSPEAITEDVFAAHLSTGDMPPVDLMIRTGGEYRISNFLLWQLAYAELYFTGTHWPEFTPADFEKALQDFSGRKRRYGAVAENA